MLKSVNRFCYREDACQCVHIPSWLMTNLWRKYSLTNTWGFTFLLTYPGATTFLIYAQELKSKWACCIDASIVTVSLTHWTCQLWKLGGTPWNFAFYTNPWMVWPSCLTLLLTTDVTTRSHSYTLQVPFAHTTSYYKSFFCEAPRLWNELPIEVVSSTSFTSFKRACRFL